jgi:hypothetical protein
MKALRIWFDESYIYVETNELKIGKMPLEWFPSFKNATEIDKNSFELWDDGTWIHWEKIGEDLSVEGFFSFDKDSQLSKTNLT